MPLREKAGGDPAELAELQLALARALWDAGRDRSRAVALAGTARAAYAAAGDRKREELAAADAWLASHRARRK